MPAVAAACRAVLREAGAPQQRRRRDHDTVPAGLRKAGVTVREYEVLRLVVDRFGNTEIAERLFLSPRTVERHVASLKARTGRQSRADLITYLNSHSDNPAQLPKAADAGSPVQVTQR